MNKLPYQSKTIISAFVIFVTMLLAMFDINITESEQKIVIDFIDAAVILAGAVGAVIGRVKAKGGIKLC